MKAFANFSWAGNDSSYFRYKWRESQHSLIPSDIFPVSFVHVTDLPTPIFLGRHLNYSFTSHYMLLITTTITNRALFTFDRKLHLQLQVKITIVLLLLCYLLSSIEPCSSAPFRSAGPYNPSCFFLLSPKVISPRPPSSRAVASVICCFGRRRFAPSPSSVASAAVASRHRRWSNHSAPQVD